MQEFRIRGEKAEENTYIQALGALAHAAIVEAIPELLVWSQPMMIAMLFVPPVRMLLLGKPGFRRAPPTPN